MNKKVWYSDWENNYWITVDENIYKRLLICKARWTSFLLPVEDLRTKVVKMIDTIFIKLEN